MKRHHPPTHKHGVREKKHRSHLAPQPGKPIAGPFPAQFPDSMAQTMRDPTTKRGHRK